MAWNFKDAGGLVTLAFPQMPSAGETGEGTMLFGGSTYYVYGWWFSGGNDVRKATVITFSGFTKPEPRQFIAVSGKCIGNEPNHPTQIDLKYLQRSSGDGICHENEIMLDAS